jgi:hypothetical protein
MDKLMLVMLLASLSFDGQVLKQLAIQYGPLLILLLVVLAIGKFLIGRLNIEVARLLQNHPSWKRLQAFLYRNNSQTFLNAWKQYFSIHGNKSFFVFSFAACASLMIASAKFLTYHADAPGMILNDPVMAFLPLKDFSLWIFILEYLCVIFLVFYLADKPSAFVRGLWSVAALFWLRIVTILLLPLRPPTDMIFLVDPFTALFFGENHQVVNDLFFSGHISLLAIFYFMTQHRYLKAFLLLATLAIAVMLVAQRVHYTLDVVAAPVFSLVVFKLIFEGRVLLWLTTLRARYEKTFS